MDVIRARKPARLPVVLTRDEIRAVLRHLSAETFLMTLLMHGAGLRLLECLRLRVEDLDIESRIITVRDGKAAWQWLFPQKRRWVDRQTGRQGRPHIDPSIVQRVVRQTVRAAGLRKRASCHTFRHSFATHLLHTRPEPRTVRGTEPDRPVRRVTRYTEPRKTLVTPGSAGVKLFVGGTCQIRIR